MNTRTYMLVLAAMGLGGCASQETDTTSTQAATEPATGAETAPAAAPAGGIDGAIAGAHRSDANRARDQYRHPKETLEFCGLEPNMTVVELSPGGGWYTEILAPVLRENGRLIAGVPGADGEGARYRQRFEEFIAANPAIYDRVTLATFEPPTAIDLGDAGSADMVLTFRNTHGWIGSGGETEAYAAAFEVLKPGGIFCVVQHRAPEGEDIPVEERAKTGYVPQSYVVEVAQQAGFVLEAESEINANPADDTDHPEGVWTLPPVLRLGDEAEYVQIGESDRMTLKFQKPMSAAPDASAPTASTTP